LGQFVNTFGPFLCRTSGNPVCIGWHLEVTYSLVIGPELLLYC